MGQLVLIGALAVALAILLWRNLAVARSLRRLVAGLQATAHGRPDGAAGWRSPSKSLDTALAALVERVIKAEQQRDSAAAAATASIEQEKARLAALLNDLHEGVLVCNLRHQLVLYNQVALKLLRVGGELGLGRPLFALMVMEPLQHCLDMLYRRDQSEGAHMPFMSRTHDARSLLQGRVSLVYAGGEPSGYVVTFDDVTAQVSALARRDALLREVIELLRAERPNTALDHAQRGYRSLVTGWWPMSDLHSGSLFELVLARLKGSPIEVSIVGLPVWLHGDGHSLVLALDALLRALSIGTGVKQFDLAAESEDACCWIMVGWVGPRITAQSLQNWQSVPVSPALGGLTVRDVIVHHTSKDPVEEERDGRQWLKLAMKPAQQPPKAEAAGERGPGRPEFFDFNLLAQGRGAAIADLPLREVTFVVFDTETTGLKPSEGDRIVSIAGVRIVGGRILTGESFNRIVNPGRPIPAESTRYHGLTDALVAGKPPIEAVLPQFKAFAADSVLVAHNAAFDLKFLRMFESDAGVTFDNPVLDTMLLSSFIDDSAEGQSLDAICRRYGVAITDRHSALGDALATAALLLHMVDALERKGIRTLGEALSTLDMTLQLHQRAQAI
jgi:DNA polymerase-3 subunit epsilon